MKIVATVTSCGDAAHVGGGVHRESAIIEIPNDKIPLVVQKFFENQEWAKSGKNRYTYEALSFSLLSEEE